MAEASPIDFFGGKMKKYIIPAAVFALLAAAGIAVYAAMRGAPVEAPSAEVRVDGETVRTLPLDQDVEFTLETQYGSNTIQVSGGEVRVTAADCPDKVCVRTGGISKGVVPIICLPHRLEVIVVSGAVDAGAY